MSGGLRDAASRYRQAAINLRDSFQRTAAGLALQGEAMARRNATADPRVRSGNLRRSITGFLEVTAATVTIGVKTGEGATETYASALEYGATIRPKRGKFLAIPGPAAMTGSGVSRYPGPRAVPDLRFVPTRGGAGGLLVRDQAGRGKAGRGARSEFFYFLVRRVTLKPRRFVGRAIDELRPRAIEQIRATVRRALGGA